LESFGEITIKRSKRELGEGEKRSRQKKGKEECVQRDHRSMCTAQEIERTGGSETDVWKIGDGRRQTEREREREREREGDERETKIN
jgi:hypothetical protein